MNYFDLTQKFIEEASRARNLTELAHLFYGLAKKIGCTHFVCMSHVDALNPPDDAIVLSNYPIEWALYHSGQGYHRLDPVFQTCKTRLSPFIWSSEMWRHYLSFDQVNILAEAGEHGLGEGYTIPIHPPKGYPASLSVVFEPGEVAPEALNALQVIAFYLYETALQMKTNRVNLYNTQKKLTEKQRRILEFIAQGKSNWDIGIILSIGESTVKDHVRNIFKVLNVRTRQQAIVKGLFLGEIEYLDVSVTPKSKTGDKSGFIHIQS